MAKKAAILRAVLFMAFFSVGLGALAVSILADELLSQCIARQQLQGTEKINEKLGMACQDYDIVFEQIQTDPNIVQRLARVTLGTGSDDNTGIYPRVSEGKRQVAEKVVLETFPTEAQPAAVPDWIVRCSEPLGRTVLFLAGAGLIIISFTCFGSRVAAKRM